MKEETIATGIRVPRSLFDAVKSAEPNKTFSEVVKRALEEKYNFIDFKPSKVHNQGLSNVDKDLDKTVSEFAPYK